MTALSSLVGGGGGMNPWPSGVPRIIMAPNSFSTAGAGANNYDVLVPFVPPTDITIDTVNWYRAVATASNVYVGIYNSSGTLLTDCAVDTNTTTGLHEVETTDANLTAGELYYWCINQSAIANAGTTANDAHANYHINFLRLMENQYDMGLLSGGTAPSDSLSLSMPLRKSRTAAALLSTLTMTGWDNNWSRYVFAGVTPA